MIRYAPIAEAMLTTITTTTTVVILQQAAIVAAFGVVVLIASLATKELLSSTQGNARVSSLAGSLEMAILPLLFAFAVLLVMKIWEVI